MSYTDIDDPTEYFETLTWSGNSTDDRAISGLDFAPDWVWIKCRNNGQNHNLFDTVRSATKSLETNNSNAEATDATSLKSFTSDGYTLGTGATVNSSSPSTKTYVSWNWSAGGSASSNSNGSITSSVSANTTAGFSIVSWSGSGANATIGHGLGAEPKMIFLKIRTGTNNWQVYNKSIGSGNALFLNTTDASSSNTGWQSTDATSSVFYVSGGTAVNGSGQNLIAYCFAEKKGYSKFGTYTGNGSTNGTFVYTGFKPALVIIKRTDNSSGANWLLLDSVRSDINVVNENLFANLTDAETSTGRCDFVSNGFKLRQSGTTVNTSSGTYIYIAFAESPFVNSNGIPNNAR